MFKKIITTYLIILTIALLASGVFIASFLKNQMVDAISNKLESNLFVLSSAIKAKSDINPSDLKNFINKQAKGIRGRITLIDHDGNILADSDSDISKMDNHNSRPEVHSARQKNIGQNIRYSNTLQQDMMYVAVPLDASKPNGVIIRLAVPLTHIEKALQVLYQTVIWVLVIVGLLAGLLGFFIIRHELKPLQEMAKVTEAIGQGKTTRKLPLTLTGEIGHLAKSINKMGDELTHRIDALYQEKEKLRTVITSMQDGVIALDSEGKVNHCNDAAMTILHIPQKLQGQFLSDHIRHEDFIATLKSTQEKQKSAQCQIDYHGRILDCRMNSLKSDGGMLIVLQDITEHVNYDTLRKEFIANVSHELRTPLTIISGFVETLKSGAMHDETTATKFLTTIDRNLQQLCNLVDDLLTLSSLESQSDFTAITDLNIATLIQQCLTDLDSLIIAKQHKIKVTIPSDLPTVKADSKLLSRALKNLIENAVKYTPDKGTITLTAEHHLDQINIKVADTGIGIPEEHLSRLFERFYRVDKSRSKAMGGTGLGLAIVKHIANLHHSKITAQSTINQGSTFTLSIPHH